MLYCLRNDFLSFLVLINIHFITFKLTKLRFVTIERLTVNNILFIHTKYNKIMYKMCCTILKRISCVFPCVK